MIVNPGGKKLPKLTTPGAAADLLTGKQLIDQYGNKVEGSMPIVEQATPSISVSSSGLITASAMQSAGKVSYGTKTETHQLSTVSGKRILPSTGDVTAIDANQFATGDIVVSGDQNFWENNIRRGKTLFGKTGIFSEISPCTYVDEYNLSIDHYLKIDLGSQKFIVMALGNNRKYSENGGTGSLMAIRTISGNAWDLYTKYNNESFDGTAEWYESSDYRNIVAEFNLHLEFAEYTEANRKLTIVPNFADYYVFSDELEYFFCVYDS